MQRVALVVALFAPVAVVTSVAAQRSQAAGHTMAFGAYVRTKSGQTRQQAVQSLESKLGRTLGVAREFLNWDEAFPTTYHNWLRDGGRTIIMSVKSKKLNGTVIPWASIANATPGSAVYDDIASWADRVKAFGAPMYFTLSHEPEASSNLPYGVDAEFIAAWRNVVSIFRARSVTNAKFMWVMTDYAFSVPPTERRFADKWYPGDSWVDGAGIDPYNWNVCRPDTPNSWRSLQTMIEPLRLWSLNHPSLELWLTEFASVEDPAQPTRKASWITAAQNLFALPAYDRFVGISYYHGEHPPPQYPDCQWWMDTSPASLSASVALANDPLFGANLSTPTTTTTTTTTSPTTTTEAATTTTEATTTTVAPTTTTTPPPLTALVVVGDSANPAAGDTTVASRLTSRGYNVTIIDDSAVTSSATADVIVVSSSVDSTTMGSKLLTTTSPILIYKPYTMANLGMTAAGAYGNVSTATVTMTSTGPLAGGLIGMVTLTSTPKNIGWGTPAASAEVISTSGGKAVEFAYVTGAIMATGNPAPSCRAALPIRHDSLAWATANLWTLFDAATDWAAAC